MAQSGGASLTVHPCPTGAYEIAQGASGMAKVPVWPFLIGPIRGLRRAEQVEVRDVGFLSRFANEPSNPVMELECSTPDRSGRGNFQKLHIFELLPAWVVPTPPRRGILD